ncbi:hypothetical protein FB472_2638 [Rhodoglobus vestalii]|uniref:Uncharacterized protein n=2 Tax=Rhodoglobus vestalii TaxID=193384 RepID=A0A8H2PZS5_9MICO|nr:hypothetical protein FB472_2638 [Rhodoglobus vestalii]
MVLLPLLTIPALLLIDTSIFLPAPGDGPLDSQVRLYTNPLYLSTVLVGWLIFIANIVLAIFDRKELMRRGIDRPFHWAFIFLGAFIYVIGRSVIVRSRTGQGLAPLWVSIAVQIAGVVAAISVVANIFIAVFEKF